MGRGARLALRLHLTEEGYGGRPEMSFLGLLAIMAAVVTALAVIGIAIAIPINSAECHQAAERQGTTGSYQFPSGCYYRLPTGAELPASEYPAKRLQIVGGGRP
jgi:hypothetical protein